MENTHNQCIDDSISYNVCIYIVSWDGGAVYRHSLEDARKFLSHIKLEHPEASANYWMSPHGHDREEYLSRLDELGLTPEQSDVINEKAWKDINKLNL